MMIEDIGDLGTHIFDAIDNFMAFENNTEPNDEECIRVIAALTIVKDGFEQMLSKRGITISSHKIIERPLQ